MHTLLDPQILKMVFILWSLWQENLTDLTSFKEQKEIIEIIISNNVMVHFPNSGISML